MCKSGTDMMSRGIQLCASQVCHRIPQGNTAPEQAFTITASAFKTHPKDLLPQVSLPLGTYDPLAAALLCRLFPGDSSRTPNLGPDAKSTLLSPNNCPQPLLSTETTHFIPADHCRAAPAQPQLLQASLSLLSILHCHTTSQLPLQLLHLPEL